MRNLTTRIKLFKFASHLVMAGLACGALALNSTSVRAQTGNGSLKVTSFPSGAEVWVDGQPTGKVTPMNVSLPVGDHSVMVRIPPVPGSGWNPDTRTVNIAAGNNDLSVTLLPMLTTGPQGPQGPAGPTGPQGPAGASPFSLIGLDAVYTQGNVGVGTMNPGMPLDVKGTPFAQQGFEGYGIVGPVQLGRWQATQDPMVIPQGSGQSLTFGTFVGGVANERMRVANNGNIGIGTAAPDASLHVRDGIAGGRGSLLVEATAENAYYNLQANAAGANNFATLVKLGPTQGAGTAGTLKLNNSGSSADNHLVISTNGNVGIGTMTPAATLHVNGNFIATGTKSTVVALPNDRSVTLYAVESPENWFEDFGSGKLIEGVAQIVLDPTFAHTVNTEITYHVFLTPNAECRGLYVAQKSPGSFEVRELGSGKSNITFDYRIVARRKGYEGLRLQQMPENR